MKKKLMSLAESNTKNRKSWYNNTDNSPKLNGIVCPKCEEELYDTNPNVTLTSYPAQKNVHCKCGYIGYRVA